LNNKREEPRGNAVCDGICQRGFTKDENSCPAWHHNGRKCKTHDKVENMMLFITSTIHGVKPQALIDNQVQSMRLMQYFPALFAPLQADKQ
jgi:hypothetical protein